jgi:spermidine synthase
MQIPLFISIFVISVCGLIYELVFGTLASYLLGDSVTQFSTLIGVYLTAMGLGAWLARFLKRDLIGAFIRVELALGLVGGFSAPALFLVFERTTAFRLPLYSLMALIGILVGTELPLLMRILKDHLDFRELVSRVFAFDYLGALAASLLFPLLLVPRLGLIRSSLLFGLFNAGVAAWALRLFRREVARPRSLSLQAGLVLCLILVGLLFSSDIQRFSDNTAYPDKVIYAKSTPYQRLILTQGGSDIRLFLNGNLQFSSLDEYRYHEALIHPGLGNVPHPKQVLVLGGGDGLALREILKYPSVESVTLVDLDPEVVRLFSTHPPLRKLNADSFHNPKVHVVQQDAFVWLQTCGGTYDFIAVDFPDPSNFSLGKLYTTAFFSRLHRVLAEGGAAVVQSTSPFVARKTFWCVVHTLRACGFIPAPYHCYVPSFGEWGFILAAKKEWEFKGPYAPGLKFLNQSTLSSMLQFPPDIGEVGTEINRLDNQVLVQYFEAEWARVLN